MKQHLYHKLVCGGTFDHLHPGHKHFLHTAFSMANLITIGLTNYPYYQKSYQSSIEPFLTRKQNLQQFLAQHGYQTRALITPLYDQCGPSISHPSYDAILVTDDTKTGANKVNFRRSKNGLKKLRILNCDFVRGFSSTRIRHGSTDTKSNLWQKKLYLPKANRFLFRQPLGKLIHSPHSLQWSTIHAKKMIAAFQPVFVAVVGDVAVHSFVDHKIFFNLAIVDQKSQRQPVYTSFHRFLEKKAQFITHLDNEPGTISPAIYQSCRQMVERQGANIIKVTGEEDLAVLPLILSLPLRSMIFYGQPHQGLVCVKVTVSKKAQVLSLLEQFV